MKIIFKALFLLIALSAVPVFAQSDFEATKARAQAGDAEAQFNLGYIYNIGEGVERNDQEAVKWYRLAAEQGYSLAQSNLGLMYANGAGVAENDQEAVRWYRLAAEDGLAIAQNNLGVMYASGTGVVQSDQEAFKWLVLAAEQGYVEAQRNLGQMYEYGTGVEQDDLEAMKWYGLAAAQGNSNADERLKALSNQLASINQFQTNVLQPPEYELTQAIDRLANLSNQPASTNRAPSNDLTSAEFNLVQAILDLSIWQLLIYGLIALGAFGMVTEYLEKKRGEKKYKEKLLHEKRMSNAKKELSLSEKSEIAVKALARYDYSTVSKIIPVLEKGEEIEKLFQEFNQKIVPVYESLIEEKGLERELVGEEIWNENLKECLELGGRLIKKHYSSGVLSADKSGENKEKYFQANSTEKSEIRSPDIVEKSEENIVFGEIKEKISKSPKSSRRWGIFTVSILMVLSHIVEAAVSESFAGPYAAFWMYAAYLSIKNDMETLSNWLYLLIGLNVAIFAVIIFFDFDLTYLDISKGELLLGIGVSLIVQTLVYKRAKYLLSIDEEKLGHRKIT